MAREIPTEAQVLSWYTALSNWGRWGPDDELGTLNLITPEKRRQAAGLVREGVVVSCARTIAYDPTPDGPVAPQHFMLRSGEGEATETLGRTNARDAFLIAPHGQTITHLDAPSHTFVRTDRSKPWTLFNGKPREMVTSDQGALAGSVELAGGGIVSRGVLLDVARTKGQEWLEPDDYVFPEDLEAAEQAQGVRVEPGDILFMRTGHPKRRAALGAEVTSQAFATWQAACLPWLRERDVALISSDTSNDCHPQHYPGLGGNGGIHGVAMGAIGLWLLDNPDFEALADACERLGRWAFLATIAPLKLERGTGSPVNPLALL
jgi:kynurenine formamidase